MNTLLCEDFHNNFHLRYRKQLLFRIPQGTVASSVRCGGQFHHHRSEISPGFWARKITKIS